MSSSDTGATSDVVVIGAGAIGTAVAWRCAQSGLDVTLVDSAARRGAWWTAAGMLAPVSELHYTETTLLRLNLASVAAFPAFAADLAEEAGIDPGLRPSGTVIAAWDAADFSTLRDLHSFAVHLGLSAELLTGRELRALEPALASGLPGGLHVVDDHQIDPRMLHAALTQACRRRGVRFVEATAAVDVVHDRAVGVRLPDGRRVQAPVVVLAAGSWSATIEGLPAPLRPPVRPVKGQTLRLRLPGGTPVSRVVRATMQGVPLYIVPRADGRMVVGASSEESGFDERPRAGAVYELLRDAQSLIPELGEAVLEELCVGLRPGSPDNAPILGTSAVPGLVFATGHYRNGISLTPVTATGITELITTGETPDLLAAFSPRRFAETARLTS